MKFIIGFLLGSLIFGGISYAYRVPQPQRIIAFDENNLVIINEVLENLWAITNGRYNLNVVTSNPDGTKGNVGDVVLYDAGAKEYLEICIGGTVWKGVEITNTP